MRLAPRRRPALAGAVALAAALGPAAAAHAQDPIPVRPDMPFVGLVNGSSTHAVITVVCTLGGTSGHPLGTQTVEVRTVLPTVAPAGYTGSAAYQIDANLVSPTGAVPNPPIVLTSFFAPAAIPNTDVFPCSGSGVVAFVPSPTSPTARSFEVPVTFANVGS